MTPRQLAEHLVACSDGTKGWVADRPAYCARMRLAIQIVLHGARGAR